MHFSKDVEILIPIYMTDQPDQVGLSRSYFRVTLQTGHSRPLIHVKMLIFIEIHDKSNTLVVSFKRIVWLFYMGHCQPFGSYSFFSCNFVDFSGIRNWIGLSGRRTF